MKLYNKTDGYFLENINFSLNTSYYSLAFAGGLYDPDTKLIRFGARDYDPEIGRWTSKDPILFFGGDVNLFSYSLLDPINNFDKNGLWSVSIEAWFGFGGKIEFGKNPGGGAFITLKVGLGIGGGAGYNPNGTSPGYGKYYDKKNKKWDFYDYYGDWNVAGGVSVEGSICAIGGLQAGYHVGAYSSYDPSHETIDKIYSESDYGPILQKPSLKIKASASAALEVSFFFGP